MTRIKIFPGNTERKIEQRQEPNSPPFRWGYIMNALQKLINALKTESCSDNLKSNISSFIAQQREVVTQLDQMNHEADKLLDNICKFLDSNAPATPEQKNELKNKIVEFRIKKTKDPAYLSLFE